MRFKKWKDVCPLLTLVISFNRIEWRDEALEGEDRQWIYSAGVWKNRQTDRHS